MEEALEYHFPSIIRLLDITTIGPYLVKHHILQMDEYYNDYQCALTHHQSDNAKLLPKLATKLRKHPQWFMDALKDCVENENCDGHRLLLDQLSGRTRTSHQVKKQAVSRRRFNIVRSTKIQKQQSHYREYSRKSAVSTPVNKRELYILESVSTTSQEENIEDHMYSERDLISAPAGNMEVYKIERDCKQLSQSKSELVHGGSQQHLYINGGSEVESTDHDVVSTSSDSSQEFGTPDNMIYKSADNSFTIPVPIDNEMSGQLQNNSEVNVFTSPLHNVECERRHNQLKSEMNEMEQKFSMIIKQLESYLGMYKAEVEQLQSQVQAITSSDLNSNVVPPHSQSTDDSCGSSFDINFVHMISHNMCYCYAQVGAHVH